MENQHRQIKGYRELSQTEIDVMNEIKAKGAELGELVSKLRITQQALTSAGYLSVLLTCKQD